MRLIFYIFFALLFASCNSRQLITSSVITITGGHDPNIVSHGSIVSSDTIINRSDSLTATSFPRSGSYAVSYNGASANAESLKRSSNSSHCPERLRGLSFD